MNTCSDEESKRENKGKLKLWDTTRREILERKNAQLEDTKTAVVEGTTEHNSNSRCRMLGFDFLEDA